MDDITRITEALKSLTSDKRRIVAELVTALGADSQPGPSESPVTHADGEGSVLPAIEGMHALLKLGVAKGAQGIPISPSETLQCLDALIRRGETVCLGTNSQAVSVKYRGILKRLYILVGDRVERVVDVESTMDETEAEELRQSRTVSVCPKKLEHARTWFLVRQVWLVTESPEPKDIRILTTGKSIAGAINAGQATFFYVQPINDLACEPV